MWLITTRFYKMADETAMDITKNAMRLISRAS